MTADQSITEYAVQMSGGGFHVRCTDPAVERIYPVAEWIAHKSRDGKVYRRRLVVVEDWTEVTEP